MTAGSALLVSHHADIIGGGEISLLTLLKGLTETTWRATLVVPEKGPLEQAANDLGVETRTLAMPALRFPGGPVLGTVRKFRRLVSDTAPAVVHANGSRAMFYAGLGARATHCPAIWHLRVIERDRRFDPVLVRLASASIANSEATRNRLRRWPGALQRCRVIPNGLDLAAFLPRRERRGVRTELGLEEADTAVVMVSRLVDFKRHDLLLEAIAALRPTQPRLRCLIVGKGAEEAGLRRRAAAEDLDGVIFFTGHREDVADVLAAADIFVLSSAEEPFGRVVLEAMAMKLPIVAAAAGGPAEILENNESGLLVEPGSSAALAAAIEELCNNPAKGRRLAAAGHRRVVERYSMESHAKEVMSMYSDLAAGTREAR